MKIEVKKAIDGDINKNTIIIHFCNEQCVRKFIYLLINNMDSSYYTHTFIHDLDVDIATYEKYFSCQYEIVQNDPTSPIIIGSNLNAETISCVVDNWGYYTFGASLFWTKSPNLSYGTVSEKNKLLIAEGAELLINQVLDYSLSASMKRPLFNLFVEIIARFIVQEM